MFCTVVVVEVVEVKLVVVEGSRISDSVQLPMCRWKLSIKQVNNLYIFS